jgi:hypothetical protein
MNKPSFLQSLLDSWQLSLSAKRAYDLIPYWIAISSCLGFLAARKLPDSLWTEKADTLVVLMGSLLAFNGIVTALSWSAFAKIYEIIGAGAFCAHLRRYKLLNQYLHFVGWCQGAQVVAISCTGFALFSFWLFQPWAGRIVVGAAVAASTYAVRQGVATSTAMQDLIWRKAEFDEDAGRPNGMKPIENGAGA